VVVGFSHSNESSAWRKSSSGCRHYHLGTVMFIASSDNARRRRHELVRRYDVRRSNPLDCRAACVVLDYGGF
jgi:hypothetical protein